MACTVHVLNLPDKLAARDLVYGLGHLEEIAESWLCARRTLGILRSVARRWNVELPEAARKTFEKTEAKYGAYFKPHDHALSPKTESHISSALPAQPVVSLLPDSKQVTQAGFSSYLGRPSYTGVTNGNYLPNTTTLHKTPPPVIPRLEDAMSLPPQGAEELKRISRQHHYVLPQTASLSDQLNGHQQQQENGMWNSQTNGDAGNSGRMTGSRPPPMLFGGVDSLIHDQDWWFTDSHQMIGDWNNHDHRDNQHHELDHHDFYSLGNGTSSPSANGSSTGEFAGGGAHGYGFGGY